MTVRQAYGAKNANWMELGDFSDVKFFSDFSILHSNGMHLIKEPSTGKCTQDMVAWGTAFDASSGTINLVQYLSWCCFNGVVHDGGTANVYGVVSAGVTD